MLATIPALGFFSALGAASLLVLVRLALILPQRVTGLRGKRKKEAPNSARRLFAKDAAPGSKGTADASPSVQTLVVLGSGGHTAEMMTLLRGVDQERYKLHFVLAASDTTSVPRLRSDAHAWPDDFRRIPRSREVGQSWLTTCWTTAVATVSCVRLVYGLRPDLVICNGPGTCIPICAVAFVLNFLGLGPRTKIVFVESFCRVKTLSFTGKLLYPIADRFVVQWRGLCERYRRAEFIGKIY